MSRTMNAVLAGFGGQGILFAGKIIAIAGLIENREVRLVFRDAAAPPTACVWPTTPSIVVLQPDVLVVMNQPSLDKLRAACSPAASWWLTRRWSAHPIRA
ncbi:MAG: hypothetical protein ACLSVD_16490 [Eggerthellaceae bacterium]